ncbi:MAG: DUF4065 domain-containing protein [Pyrinomonadaceae bacterium]|nr:DUF4065 domain-containing protein [Pyrinomonadaceae bacterium]
MPRANDVAAFILGEHGSMTAMKLQKLVYYSQAWSLVWDERALFDDPIEAWANGPVTPSLYQEHKGLFVIGRNDVNGNPDALDNEAKETIRAVLKFYGGKSAQWLSDLTHSEDPWRNARAGTPDGVRGNEVISHAAMAEYYSGL